ncbi:unnamed protein product, partial [Mesorhabditis belari]|uniref:Uncharacterized protein n=1 Tax=Mesorhabditis belari TaxID=2138241 RepID=A0AAF3FUQ4_9BILA
MILAWGVDTKKEKRMSADAGRRQSWVGRRMSVQSQNSFQGPLHCSRDLVGHKERIAVISPAKDETVKVNDITQCALLCEKYHVETNHKEYFVKPYIEVKRLYPDALFEFYEKHFGQKLVKGKI